MSRGKHVMCSAQFKKPAYSNEIEKWKEASTQLKLKSQLEANDNCKGQPCVLFGHRELEGREKGKAWSCRDGEFWAGNELSMVKAERWCCQLHCMGEIVRGWLRCSFWAGKCLTSWDYHHQSITVSIKHIYISNEISPRRQMKDHSRRTHSDANKYNPWN